MFHPEHSHGIEMVQIKSSLSLQSMIFYQGIFSILYLISSGGCLLNKVCNYRFQNGILEILTMPIFLLWSCTEFTRIVLGYVGNVSERVPMMSAFLLLTIFPQFVAVLFLTARQDPVFPLDHAAGIIMLLYLCIELCVGRITLNALIKRQTAQFSRLCQEQENQRMHSLETTPLR
jgi:transmembrane protein 17